MQHIEFSYETSRLDWPRITGWLAGSYWSPGIHESWVRQAAAGSAVVIGAFIAGEQVGYARVVSDTVRFAYLADVFVEPAFRGQGIATAMVKQLFAHPKLAGIGSCMLSTRDMHALYAPLGFAPLATPERMMAWRNPDAHDFTQPAALAVAQKHN